MGAASRAYRTSSERERIMERSTHTLKVEPPYFDSILDGSKPFEIRKNDRAYQRGDTLLLREWDPTGSPSHRGTYTGREVTREVTFVYAGDPRWPHALGLGVVVLGLGETSG